MNIDEEDVYGIVYKITNTINGRSYIGIISSKRGLKKDIKCIEEQRLNGETLAKQAM